MKFKLNALFVAAGLWAILGVVPATAQQGSEAKMKVPFAFKAESRSFPAGDYHLKPVNDGGVFQLSDASGKSLFVSAPIQATSDPDKPHLGFTCSGGECILSEIALPGKMHTQKVTERDIQKNLTHKLGMVSMISIRLGSR